MEKTALLFDLDGVIIDTESQYDIFWHEIGVRYLGDESFQSIIKGSTLTNILGKYFPGRDRDQEEISKAVERYEDSMHYDLIPGAGAFLDSIDRKECLTAVVTSSNEKKLSAVLKAHPEFTRLFDRILTAEMFLKSKPDPGCYLLGMELFQTPASRTVVFEDSFSGLEAARGSGARVVGLATTNRKEDVASYSDLVLEDFRGISAPELLLKLGL